MFGFGFGGLSLFAGLIYSCWFVSWFVDLLLTVMVAGLRVGCVLAVLRCYLACAGFL